jgi:20S proteasome alpha/beta subunit
MTSVVGILCQDGVVIGADSSATFYQEGQVSVPMIEQPFEKIDIIDNHIILVGTGGIGQGQRFKDIIQKAWNSKKIQGIDALTAGRILSADAMKDFAETKAQFGKYGALVAFPCYGKAHLTEFALSDFQPEMKTDKLWFVSMGSAQHITDTFLAFLREVFWKNTLPNVNDGIFATKWTLDHAVAINPGGVNGPVRIAVLEKIDSAYHARIIPDTDLQETIQGIASVKTALAKFRSDYMSVNQEEVPTVPQPALSSSPNGLGDESATPKVPTTATAIEKNKHRH